MKRLISLLLILLLLACVPTPSEEVIVNKSDGSMVQAIAAPKAETVRYEAPAHWEETVSMKNLKIKFDADVILPEGNVYPVQTVRRHEFTPEDVFALLNACFTGPFELRENRYGMPEIEEDIRLLLRGNLVDWDDETGEVIWEPFTEEPEELAELKEKMAQCPVEDTFVPLEPSRLTYDNDPTVLRAADGRLLYLRYTKNALHIRTARNVDVQNEATVYQGGFVGEPWHRTLDQVTISEKTACETADRFLSKAGLADQFGVGYIEKARMVRATVEAPYYEELSEGYLLHLARSGGGYVPYPQGGGYFSEDSASAMHRSLTEADFSQKWSMDWIMAYVTENGIESIEWYEPNEYVKEANENVVLMPFDEAQKHIRDTMKHCYAWTDEGGAAFEIHVKKIILSCSISRLPNNPDEAVLAPVWVVVYQNSRYKTALKHDSILLINALDGSFQHAL